MAPLRTMPQFRPTTVWLMGGEDGSKPRLSARCSAKPRPEGTRPSSTPFQKRRHTMISAVRRSSARSTIVGASQSSGSPPPLSTTKVTPLSTSANKRLKSSQPWLVMGLVLEGQAHGTALLPGAPGRLGELHVARAVLEAGERDGLPVPNRGDELRLDLPVGRHARRDLHPGPLAVPGPRTVQTSAGGARG